jgi:hypothetical protein
VEFKIEILNLQKKLGVFSRDLNNEYNFYNAQLKDLLQFDTKFNPLIS